MLSNPADQKKLADAVKEMSASMTRVDAEKDLQKNIVDDLHDELGLEKKYVKKVAQLWHKQNFAQVQTEQEEIEGLYELISG